MSGAESIERYVVCGSRPWNRRTFEELFSGTHGRWEFAATPDELSAALEDAAWPRFIFFLHWSWIVPDDIVDSYECVVFHMTAVPYGRGGSPLQNLISRGHDRTSVTALRMTTELDAGPVYMSRELLLRGSTAEEIYLRSDQLCLDMIREMVREPHVPVPQEGEVVTFARRRPADSAIPIDLPDLEALCDFIRMLDAESYPRAFIDHGGYRIMFSRSVRYDGRVVADATFTQLEAER